MFVTQFLVDQFNLCFRQESAAAGLVHCSACDQPSDSSYGRLRQCGPARHRGKAPAAALRPGAYSRTALKKRRRPINIPKRGGSGALRRRAV